MPSTASRRPMLMIAFTFGITPLVGYFTDTPAGANRVTFPETQQLGVLYSEVEPQFAPNIDAAYDQLLAAGINSYEIVAAWRDLIAEDNSLNLTPITEPLEIIRPAGLRPYVGIPTIDTNNLRLPTQFVDPANERELAPGIDFDDPALIAAFGEVLDAVVPLLRAESGIALVVGNEVDIWLADRPAQLHPFLEFVAAAKARIRRLAPELPVGVAITFSGAKANPILATRLIDASDAAFFTYYPLRDDLQLDTPINIARDLDRMLQFAGDKPLLLQEIGCPSGYGQDSIAPASNYSYDAQREFFEQMVPAITARPAIKFASVLALADWPATAVEELTDYYGLDSPVFVEYLATLGVLEEDGTAKPAFEALLTGLHARPKTTANVRASTGS